MQIFLDTANIEEIREIAPWGVLSGVTTNPSLLAKEGDVDFKQVIQEIAALVDGPISAEVTSEDPQEMIQQGKEFSTWHKNVVIKIPITPTGLEAISALSAENIKTNATLCFSTNQALLVARAGATYVSPFIGRIDDIGADGMIIIEEIAQLFSIHNLPTQIITASVRTPLHVTQAALAGADIATIPYAVIKKMIKHPLTDKGQEKFLSDWKKLQTK